ncbi:MAG: SEC-C domain-containing protein [Treponema sp.]|nr:SEC-C domain-containing protein [Treponema sp.]
MEKNPDMFRDDYILYLEGIKNLDLFTGENYLQYYEKFAEYFIKDENPEEYIYVKVMNLIPSLIKKDELIPFIEKILPTLEKSRHRSEEDKKSFKYIRAAVVHYRLHRDKRIHDVLVDMTIFFLVEDEDKKEQLSMEHYIVSELSVLRPSIKVLKNEYPEYFKLNQSFYFDALNEKKTDFLIDKYSHVYKKISHAAKNEPGYFGFRGWTGEDNNNTDESNPFVRSSPKVGRNDPCPCGSGKKYKKCCAGN